MKSSQIRRGASSREYSVSVIGPCSAKNLAAWRFNIVPTYSDSTNTSSVLIVRQPIKRPRDGSRASLSKRISRICSFPIELFPASQKTMDGWFLNAMMTSRISSTRWSHCLPKFSFSLSPAGCVQIIPWRSNARISDGAAATCIQRMWFALLSLISLASFNHSGAIPIAAHSFVALCA